MADGLFSKHTSRISNVRRPLHPGRLFCWLSFAFQTEVFSKAVFDAISNLIEKPFRVSNARWSVFKTHRWRLSFPCWQKEVVQRSPEVEVVKFIQFSNTTVFSTHGTTHGLFFRPISDEERNSQSGAIGYLMRIDET